MRELSLREQQDIYGGSPIVQALLYILLGSGIYKIITSSKGRISIPKLLNIEWKQ